MYPFILCYSCGRSLADSYDLYRAMTAALISKAYTAAGTNIDPSVLAISDNVETETGPVLDLLHLHVQCCRAHMMSQVLFHDLY